MYIFQFFFGMFLGFYVMYGGLRRPVNKVLFYPIRLVWEYKTREPIRISAPKQKTRWIDVTWKLKVKPAPREEALINLAKPLDMTKRYVQSTPVEIEEWLKNNPDLKVRNGG